MERVNSFVALGHRIEGLGEFRWSNDIFCLSLRQRAQATRENQTSASVSWHCRADSKVWPVNSSRGLTWWASWGSLCCIGQGTRGGTSPSTSSRKRATAPGLPPFLPARRCWGRWRETAGEEQANCFVSSATFSRHHEAWDDLTDQETDEKPVWF